MGRARRAGIPYGPGAAAEYVELSRDPRARTVSAARTTRRASAQAAITSANSGPRTRSATRIAKIGPRRRRASAGIGSTSGRRATAPRSCRATERSSRPCCAAIQLTPSPRRRRGYEPTAWCLIAHRVVLDNHTGSATPARGGSATRPRAPTATPRRPRSPRSRSPWATSRSGLRFLRGHSPDGLRRRRGYDVDIQTGARRRYSHVLARSGDAFYVAGSGARGVLGDGVPHHHSVSEPTRLDLMALD